jgi:ADP-ribose pyrophosphatase
MADTSPMPAGPDMAASRDLTEHELSSETAWQGGFLHIKRDRVRLPDGRDSQREYVVHPGAAVMIPLLDDGRILVERQYRYPLRRHFIEVPAGKLDPGESPLATARRELLEETGYQAAEWALLTVLHPAIGFATEEMHVYLCRGLKHSGQQLDVDEHLEVMAVTLDWLLDELRAGRLTDVKTQISVFWLERLRSGAWPWPAFEPS